MGSRVHQEMVAGAVLRRLRSTIVEIREEDRGCLVLQLLGVN